MTVDEWLDSATADADRRHLLALKPLLESFARSLARLRDADFNRRADDDSASRSATAPPPGFDRAEPARSDVRLQNSDAPASLTIESFGGQLRRGDITSVEM